MLPTDVHQEEGIQCDGDRVLRHAEYGMMDEMPTSPLKPVVWLGDSLRELRTFPAGVQDEMGYAIYLAQCGRKHVAAKPLKGLGAGVLEVVSDHRGDTFRIGLHRPFRRPRVRVARVPEEVEERARDAEGRHRADQAAPEAGCRDQQEEGVKPMARKDYIVGSGNVFEDLGHPRPAEALAKAELARKIGALIAKRGLTQAAAADVLKIDQPKVSALVRGRLAGYSLDRLVRFLVLLGSDVEIVVKPRTRATGRARVMVA